MTDLTPLKFLVDTTELDRASKAIGALVQDMSQLSISSAQTAKISAQTEAILARAASSYADARKKNAEAAEKELRSAIAADKADQQREKSTSKATDAVDKSTGATKKNSEAVSDNTTVLQRQSDILEFQAQGWSKSQAGILATAKAAKTAAGDMQELMRVLETQRKLMGTDPFDKSMSGLKSLQNQYSELKESLRQYNADTDLTMKQTKELARDKQRILEQLKVEGASFSEVRAAIRAYNAEYNALAAQYNKLANAEAGVIKQRKEMVSASNYVIQAEEKMKAALDATNSSLNKAATDDLVRYETALRKSGMSQDLMTEKLATYKNQLAQVQAQEQKRAADHLARSLSPQLTDIGVSLWSGQSPLTVLIQQGGQMMDLFRMSGVEAKDFGRVMRESFDSMIPAMATVAKGIGSFVIGAFMDAGKAATAFLSEYSKITPIMESVNQRFADAGKESSLLAMSLRSLGNVLPVVFATGIAAVIAMIAGALVAIKQVIAEEDALGKALAVSGGYLNLSQAEAVKYAKSMNDVGVSTSKAIGVITEMAKVGNLGKESFSSIAQSASDAQKWIGISVTDTVKKFSDLVKDPMKVLSEFTIQTGLLSQEQLGAVRSLLETGDAAGAQKLAIELLQQGYSDMTNEAKANMSAISASTIELQSATSALWDEFKNSTVAVGSINAVSYVVGVLNAAVQTGIIAFKSLYAIVVAAGQGIANVYNNMLSPSAMLAGFTKIGTELKTSIIGALDSGATTVVNYSNAVNGAAGSVSNLTVEQRKAQSVAESGSKAFEVFSTKVEGSAKDQVKELNKQSYAHKRLLEDVKASTAGMSAEQKQAFLNTEKYGAMATKALAKYGEEWDKAKKKDKPKGGDSYFATTMKKFRDEAIEATTATDNLTKSQEELLKVTADPKFLALSKARQTEILQLAAQTIAVEQLERARIQEGKAEEFRQKVLGKSEGLGKQYYEDIDKLLAFRDAGKFTQEQTEELTRAIYESTPVWKKYAKDVEEAQKALNKYNEESIASQADSSKENLNLDLRLFLLGKTTEQQKILQREHERNIKLSEVDLDLAKKKREIELSISKARKDNLPEDGKELQGLTSALEQADRDAAEKRKVINRDVAVQYAEDMQKEFDRISGGITDSIVTALFEGGKAGSASIRSLIVNELKKPVTLVVQTVVNALLGNVIGGLGGGAGGSAGGMLQTAGNLNSLFGTAVQGLFGSSVGASTASIFGANAVGMAGGDALGALIAANGQWAGVAAGATSAAEAAVAANLALEAGAGIALETGTLATAAAEASAATAASSTSMLASIPGWGWALAGVALLAGSGIGSTRGANHSGGLYSSLGQTNQEAASQLTGKLGWKGPEEDFTKRGNTELNKQVESTVKGLLELYNGLGKLASGTVKELEVVAGFATNSKYDDEESYGYFQIMNKATGELLKDYTNRDMDKDGGIAWEQYVADLGTAMISELRASDIPSWMDGILEELGDAPTFENFSKAVAEIHKIDQAFSTFSKNIVGFAGMTDKTFEALMKGAGGIDKLTQMLTSYYDNFYSEAEKELNIRNQLTAALSEQNLTLPKTKDEYRKLVEAQDLTTEAGRKNYAVLLKNAGAFSELTPEVEVASKQVQGINKVFAGLGMTAKVSETKFSKSVKEMFESLGLSVEDYSNSIASVIEGVVTGKIKAEDAGKELADAAVGGITNAIAQGASQAIAAQFVNSIITPIIANIMAGNEALAGINLEAGLANLQTGVTALGTVLQQIGPTIGGIAAEAAAIISGSVAGVQGATTTSSGGGYSGSAFAIGGSAVDNRFQSPALEAFGNLATETMASNQKVSELLQKLLNPKKEYANRYLELADNLIDKQKEHNLEYRKQQIQNMKDSYADAQRMLGVITPIVDEIAVNFQQVASGISNKGEQFDKLAELIIEKGGYDPNSGLMFIDLARTVGFYIGQTLEGETPEYRVSRSLTDLYGEDPDGFMSMLKTAVGISNVTTRDITAATENLAKLEKELREWYIAQARVIAVEDYATNLEEAAAARKKTAELKRTGGLEDPVTKLKEQFAAKMQALDEGINKALRDEIDRLNKQKPDAEVMQGLEGILTTAKSTLSAVTGDQLPTTIQFYEDEIAGMQEASSGIDWTDNASAIFGLHLSKQISEYFKMLGKIKSGEAASAAQTAVDNAEQAIKDAILAATDPAKRKELQDEIDKYEGGVTEWFKAQAELLSTEMLVDINSQIKALETEEKGPLSTIKDAIQKYIDDFTELGTLNDEAKAKLEKLSGLQLTKARKELYDQLLTPEEVTANAKAKLQTDFGDVITGAKTSILTNGIEQALLGVPVEDTSALMALLEGMGTELPTTAAGFRALLDGIDTTTTAGQNLYDMLLQLVPGFIAVTDAAGGTVENIRQTFEDAYKNQLGRAPDAAGLEYWVSMVSSGTLTLEQALKAFSEGATTEGLNNRILELTDAEGYLSLMRKNELSLLSSTNQALKQRIYDLEDEAKALQFLAEITRTRVDADIKLLQAQGNASEAEKLQREQFIAGLTGLTAAQKEAKIAAYDYSAAIDKQVKVLQERVGLENRLNQLLGNTSLLRAQELEKLDESNRALQERIWGIEDADKAVSSALSAVERAIGAEKERIQKETDAQILAIRQGIDGSKESLDNAQKQVDLLSGIFDKITAAVKTLRGSVDEERKMLDARGYIDASIALAKTGVIPDSEKLSEAIGVVTSNQTSGYSTRNDFIREQQIQANKLEELASILGVQKTTEEQQLDTLKSANKLAEEQIAAIENARKQQLEALDMQLLKAREQVDVMRGVDISIKSVGTSIDALSAAIAGYQQIIAGAITASQSSSVTQPPKTGVINPITAEPIEWTSGSDSWNAGGSNVQFGSGFSMGFDSSLSKEQIADVLQSNIAEAQRLYESGWSQDTGAYGAQAEIAEWARENKIPGFAVGTNYVPEDMLATIHKGEMIVPKKFNPATSGIQQDNSELVTELKALRTEVQMLRAEARATAVNTSKTARILDDVTQGGDTLKTEVAA